jgi:magnesium-transporting ATPase (P-type)
MNPNLLPRQDLSEQSGTDPYAEMRSRPDGLTAAEAARRLAQFGPNALAVKKESPWLKFLRNFWGPIPWMIEVAAGLSAMVGHWAKLHVYRHLELRTRRHRKFLDLIKQPLHAQTV